MSKSKEAICPQCTQKRKISSDRKICYGCRKMNMDIKSGVLRTPEFQEVNVEGYKEPMQKVEDGFGYYGAITVTNDGKHIQCHICGYYFSSIGSHVKSKHEVKSRDYKMKYGLRLAEGLLSPIEKFKRQISYNKYARKSPEEFKAMSVKAQIAIKEKGIKNGGDMWSPQTRNEKGMCEDQTIAKIRRVAELCGGIPTYQAYVDEYGGVAVVYHWFGTWEKALEAADVVSYLKSRKKAIKEEKEHVIDLIREFYEEHGRTPQTADFNGLGMFPSQRRMTRLFGSLNSARVAAEVPTLVYVGHKWVEVPVGEESLNGIVPSFAHKGRKSYGR